MGEARERRTQPDLGPHYQVQRPLLCIPIGSLTLGPWRFYPQPGRRGYFILYVCKMSVALLRYSVLRGQNCIAVQQRYARPLFVVILVSHPLPAFFVGAGFSDHY